MPNPCFVKTFGQNRAYNYIRNHLFVEKWYCNSNLGMIEYHCNFIFIYFGKVIYGKSI